MAAGQRVRLPSGLSPLVSLLGYRVPLLVGHCVPWSLCPPCLPSFFLCFWSCLPCGSLCPSCLPSCSSLRPSCLPSVIFCLVSFCLPLVGHCACLVPSASLCLRSCLPSCFPFCLSLCPPAFLSPFIVSACFPFAPGLVSLLFPFVFLLVGHCVRLVFLLFLFVSALCPSCLPFVSFCLLSCWSLCPPCLSLCLRSCLPSCWSLCQSCLPSVSFLLPSCLPSCWSLCPPCFPLSPVLSPFLSPLLSRTLHICLPAALPCNITFVSQSSGLRVPCNPLHYHLSPCVYMCLPALDCCVRAILHICLPALAAVSASALQSFAFVSQRWAAVSASALILHLSPSSDCCVRLCLAILYMCPRKPLRVSPSSRLLYPPLPCNLYLSPSSGLHVACNPLQLSPCVYICLPALDCCGRLCLAILCLPALDVANSRRRVFRY